MDLFAPTRKRLADVRAVLHNIVLPAEAWETLAVRGLIPLDAVGAARRGFDASREHPFKDLPHPPTVAACAALASDWSGVLRAEALARETISRLARWGTAQPQHVVWSVRPVGGETEWPLLPRGWPEVVVASVLIAAGSAGAAERARWRVVSNTADRFGCRELGPRTVAAIAAADATWGQWFPAACPSPFEPLTAIWSTGYALESISNAAVTLVCPALP